MTSKINFEDKLFIWIFVLSFLAICVGMIWIEQFANILHGLWTFAIMYATYVIYRMFRMRKSD